MGIDAVIVALTEEMISKLICFNFNSVIFMRIKQVYRFNRNLVWLQRKINKKKKLNNQLAFPEIDFTDFSSYILYKEQMFYLIFATNSMI